MCATEFGSGGQAYNVRTYDILGMFLVTKIGQNKCLMLNMLCAVFSVWYVKPSLGA